MTLPAVALIRPEPILRHRAQAIDERFDPDKAAAKLEAGEQLLVSDRHRTGLVVLERLAERLGGRPTEAAKAPIRRAFQQKYDVAAARLIAPIRGHRLALQAAPEIGFFRMLYPDHSDFFLPMEEVRRLHNGWRTYDEGVPLTVLGSKIHPFYGTYAPHRTVHLELFATWLSQHTGPRATAIDVGTGCGVLALMLCRSGFTDVVATDINPNAVESVRRELQRRMAPPIRPVCVDLFEARAVPVDLIVFNPPWTKGTVGGLLDRAMVYEDGLFERFFDQALERLGPDGRVVMVFSNLIRLVQPDVPHPIDTELARGRFRLVQMIHRRVKPPKNGPLRRTKERVEVWELARA